MAIGQWAVQWAFVWGQALLWQPETLTNLPADYEVAKSNGADIMKQYAMSNVTTDDIDQKIETNKTKKFEAFAEILKYAKANNISTDPKMVKTMADQIMVNMDNENAVLLKQKQQRLLNAEQQWAMEYQTLSASFLDARKKQMGLNNEIIAESQKPVSDPDRIVELKAQKDEADKKVEKIKKDFSKKWINEPDAILREWENMQQDIQDLQSRWVSPEQQKAILTAKYPDQEVTAMGMTAGGWQATLDQLRGGLINKQYDDAEWQFNAPAFLADVQKIPEYRGLTPTQVGEKLIDTDNDIGSLQDIFYVVHKSTSDVKPVIQKLIDKNIFSEDQILDIVINGYLKNATTKEQSLMTLNKLLGSLKEMEADKDIVKAILADNGLDMSWRKAVQSSK